MEFEYGDVAKTGLEDNSASLVSLALVVHELSTEGRRAVREGEREEQPRLLADYSLNDKGDKFLYCWKSKPNREMVHFFGANLNAKYVSCVFFNKSANTRN